MKKAVFASALLSAVLFVGVYAYAEDQNSPNENQEWERQGKADGKKMMGQMKMKGMHQQPTMIATSDGGVIILSGPKLLKYDSELNLVKEIELKPGPKPTNREGAGEPQVNSEGPQEPMDPGINAAGVGPSYEPQDGSGGGQ